MQPTEWTTYVVIIRIHTFTASVTSVCAARDRNPLYVSHDLLCTLTVVELARKCLYSKKKEEYFAKADIRRTVIKLYCTYADSCLHNYAAYI